MTINVKLTVSYDGTNYLGWQKTKEGKSIEETLQLAIEQILQEKVSLQAASRTDAGVHARHQIVNFFTIKKITDYRALCIGLNALLPKDISVFHAEPMGEEFHPTLDAKGKEYHYLICSSMAQNPLQRHYAWHYHYPLDLHLMRQAATRLIGTHDFSGFTNVKKNEQAATHTRTIDRIEILPEKEDLLCIKVSGSHFLYKMVRNIVGTLAYVGRGKLTVKDVENILIRGNRKEAGVTAPAHGLLLYEVRF